MEKQRLTLDPAKQVQKFLRKQQKKVAERLVIAMEKLAIYPPEGLDITLMVGKGKKGEARVRVGEYRILIKYDFPNRTVHINRIDTRDDVYKEY